MALIRSKRVEANAGGRAGCQFQSPYSGAIYYASVEHGAMYLRDWAGDARARQDGVTLVPTGVSACFAAPGQVCATIVGFPANTDQSGMDTYLIDMAE